MPIPRPSHPALLLCAALLCASVGAYGEADHPTPPDSLGPTLQRALSGDTAAQGALLERYEDRLESVGWDGEPSDFRLWKAAGHDADLPVAWVGYCGTGPYHGGLLLLDGQGQLTGLIELGCVTDIEQRDLNGDGTRDLRVRTLSTGTGIEQQTVHWLVFSGGQVTGKARTPTLWTSEQHDLDGDGVGDNSDPDPDGDGIGDNADPDRDGDGYTNAEEGDPAPTPPIPPASPPL